MRESKMKVECAWCGKDLGEKPGPEGATSHGICKECADVMIQEIKTNHESEGEQK